MSDDGATARPITTTPPLVDGPMRRTSNTLGHGGTWRFRMKFGPTLGPFMDPILDSHKAKDNAKTKQNGRLGAGSRSLGSGVHLGHSERWKGTKNGGSRIANHNAGRLDRGAASFRFWKPTRVRTGSTWDNREVKYQWEKSTGPQRQPARRLGGSILQGRPWDPASIDPQAVGYHFG